MPTPFPIIGVLGATGRKAVARLTLPASLVATTGTTVSGGALASTATLGATSAYLYLPLAEVETGNYRGIGTIAGTVLPDTSAATGPVTIEVRWVNPATDTTVYANLAAAFSGAQAYWAGLGSGYSAVSAYAFTEEPYKMAGGAFLKGGAWQADPTLDAAVSGVPGSLLGALVDGTITIQQAFIADRAFRNGKTSLTVNGDGTETLTFFKSDGTTPAFVITYNSTTGVRASGGTG